MSHNLTRGLREGKDNVLGRMRKGVKPYDHISNQFYSESLLRYRYIQFISTLKREK